MAFNRARGRMGAVEEACGREEVGGFESRLEVDPYGKRKELRARADGRGGRGVRKGRGGRGWKKFWREGVRFKKELTRAKRSDIIKVKKYRKRSCEKHERFFLPILRQEG